MILEKEYNDLIRRLNLPENAKKKNSLSFQPNGYDLVFHLKRIDTYVKAASSNENNINLNLMELDYMVSLRYAKEIMDEQSWQ